MFLNLILTINSWRKGRFAIFAVCLIDAFSSVARTAVSFNRCVNVLFIIVSSAAVVFAANTVINFHISFLCVQAHCSGMSFISRLAFASIALRRCQFRHFGSAPKPPASVLGLVQAGKFDEALKLLEQSKSEWSPDTFVALQAACAKSGALANGRRVHELAKGHKAAESAAYLNSLLNMYARCGELDEARSVLAELQRKGLASAASYSAMIGGLARAGRLEEAVKLLKAGSARRFAWEDRDFGPLLMACGDASDLVTGKQLHKLALEHKAVDVECSNGLIHMYLRCGEPKEAWNAFDNLKRRGLANAASYAIVISERARAHEINEAEQLLDESMGLQWDSGTLTTLLAACCESGAVSIGKRVHELAVAHEAADDKHFMASLLDMYTRCGELEEAEGVFEKLKWRGLLDAVGYAALINGALYHLCIALPLDASFMVHCQATGLQGCQRTPSLSSKTCSR